MNTFLNYVIAMNAVGLVLTAIIISFSNYPRTVKCSAGVDVFKLLNIVAVLAWACWLRFPA